jgi:hypothetical protein
LPPSQYGIVNAYARRFLLGDTGAATHADDTDGTFDQDTSRWMPWRAPTLY